MRADEHHQWELEQQERLEKDPAFRRLMLGSKTITDALLKLKHSMRKRKHAIYRTRENV